tara:strand:- start:41 stop:622 length:582 start_codon:yes stop_codon:yes gene_type:complete
LISNIEKKFLFLVVLGGKTTKANVELHDVRWVIGSKIEDTFDVLRSEWFGSLEGLHIDSYKKIQHVDGHKINLRKTEIKKKNDFLPRKIFKKNLWFVNIGGYHPSSMQEQHEFGLVVASSSTEAKNIAKSKWLCGFLKKHKDDISSLKKLITLDDCELIKRIGTWEIELTKENNLFEEDNSPDWFGYKRIDKI